MSEAKPLVSICIANYNGMDIIDDCLRSVLGQQGNFAIEILVHDDASTDGSADHVRTHYPGVKQIRSDSNVGFCIANNRMASEAIGQYILLLNNDAALFPDALQTLLKEACQIDKPAILTLPQFDATSGVLVDRGCLLDPFFNPVPNLDPKRQDVAMVIGACLWIPKTLWDELEGFPEWFGSIAEDMYLCCRARLAGFAVRALDTSGYRHWQGKSFGGNRTQGGAISTTFRRRRLSEQNKTYVMVMTCPQPFWLLLVVLHLFLLGIEGTLLSIVRWRKEYLINIYLPVFVGVLRNSKELKKIRTDVMLNATRSSLSFFSTFKVLPHKLRMLFRHGLPEVMP